MNKRKHKFIRPSVLTFSDKLVRSDDDDQKFFWVVIRKHQLEAPRKDLVWPAQWCKIHKNYTAGGGWFEIDEIIAVAPMIVPEINHDNFTEYFQSNKTASKNTVSQ